MNCIYKGKFFSAEKVERITDEALRLLSNVGVRVPDKELFEKLTAFGFLGKGDRIVIEEKRARDHLEKLRSRELETAGCAQAPAELSGLIGIYSFRLESFEHRGETILMTVDELERAARFSENCCKRYGVKSNVPGYASDIPAPLQSLHRYMVGAKYCSALGEGEPSSVFASQYMFPMAEVMGSPIKRLPIYPISPLCLAGESVSVALARAEDISSAYVYCMPFMGISTPLSVSMSFAVNLAEVMGCSILMESLLSVPVDIRPSILPFDIKVLTPGFGTSEKLLCELMAADFYAQLFQTDLRYSSTNIHTMAKVADEQAATEKTSLMVAGALNGARRFYCLGTVAMDETFSPYQLIMDLEAMKQVDILLRGFPEDDLEEGFSDYVQSFLDAGFLMDDRTLDNYEAYFYHSEIYDRATSDEVAASHANRRITEAVRELDALPPAFLLEDEKLFAIEQIYEHAKKALAGTA